MKMRLLALVFTAAAMSATAHAATIFGSVWDNGTSGAVVTPVPAGSPTATFTVSGPADIFNFVSTTGATYNTTSFLTAGGDTVTYLTGGSTSLSNTEFQFTGGTYLVAGVTYSFQHDDGMILYLTGNGLTNSAVINSGSPTTLRTDSFTVATTGLYSFNLLYAEVGGAPADLISTNFSAATPEPSSIVMLGSGLLAGAGMLRRRMKA